MSATAQTLSPVVIATSGGYTFAGGYSLSWTAGETFTKTLQAGDSILNQGFQQPFSTLGTLPVTLIDFTVE